MFVVLLSMDTVYTHSNITDKFKSVEWKETGYKL